MSKKIMVLAVLSLMVALMVAASVQVTGACSTGQLLPC